MKTSPPCVEWRERLALRHEDLSLADQQALDAHVDKCEACATALADYHFFEARLDALPPPAIRPLPRLSPHFFEQSESGRKNRRKLARTDPARLRPERKAGKVVTITRRVFSIAAVLCLMIAAGLLFRTIYMAHLASRPGGETLLNFNQHNGAVTSAAWSHNGKYIATASMDDTAKIWDAQSGTVICTYPSSDMFYAVAWSPDGKHIALGSGDGTVQIVNAANCSHYKTYTGQTNSIMSVAWSYDGKYVASGSWDHTVLIWNVSTGDVIKSFQFNEYVASVSWSPINDEIAIGTWDDVDSVQIWDLSAKKMLQTRSYVQPVNAVAWSPDGKYIAIGNQSDTIEVRNAANWKLICTYDEYTHSANPPSITTVAWSPDGKYIASGGDDKTVRVWSPFSRGTPTLMTYNQHTGDVSSVAWSPDGKEIVSGSWDDTAKIWKVVGQ